MRFFMFVDKSFYFYAKKKINENNFEIWIFQYLPVTTTEHWRTLANTDLYNLK